MAAGGEVLTQDLPSELFETAIPDSPTHMQPDSWATLLGQWADRALRSGHQNLLSEAQPEMERTLLTTPCVIRKGISRSRATARMGT